MDKGAWTTLWVLLVVAGTAPAVRAQPPIPSYPSRVAAAQAFVHGGPGDEFYPTAILQRDDPVTVVGARRGDWVAIEPPTGSFSLVPAKQRIGNEDRPTLREEPDGSAIVLVDAVNAQVGSTLSDAAFVYQTSLKRGDRVQIVDQVHRGRGDRIETWFKILPPAGEVRYLRADQVAIPVGSPAGPRAPPDQGSASAAERSTGPAPAESANGLIPAARPISGNGSTSRSSALPLRSVSAQRTPVSVEDDPSKPFEERLSSVAVQLEVMRSRDPARWDLASARSVLEKLRQEAQGVEAKSKVFKLLARVDRWEPLQRRYLESQRQTQSALDRDEELQALQDRLASRIVESASVFAAEGVLERSTVDLDGQRAFALRDFKGVSTHYVVPVPGLNLADYVGQQVGLVGELQPRRGLPIPVVVAQQLVPRQPTNAGTPPRSLPPTGLQGAIP